MPLRTEQVEILLEGLNQKTDDKVLPAGKLTRAENVEFDKEGSLNKRRGYIRLPALSTGSISATDEIAFSRASTYRDTLVVFGIEHLHVITDPQEEVDGTYAVHHARLLKGQLRIHHISTSQQREERDA